MEKEKLEKIIEKHNLDDINENTLWKLRKEIVLGSLYYSDYANSFGFTTHSVCDFFDSYLDYLVELAEEKFGINYTYEDALSFDNEYNLYNWWGCYETFPFEIE
jgi:hypothetical protein